MPGYLRATRHPWSSFLFLLPLLICYEVGVYAIAGSEATAARNGADAWLRRMLADYHPLAAAAPPWILVIWLLFWSAWCWGDRPQEMIGTCFGMALESAIFAGVLWLISHNFRLLLERAGVPLTQVLATDEATAARLAIIGRILEYLGAGIYEEVIFRLMLFTFLVLLFRVALLPGIIAKILAAVAGAILFSAAHHLGPNGERVEQMTFLFRVFAGLFFTLLYQARGFGVAVGAHAGYDVLAGVAV